MLAVSAQLRRFLGGKQLKIQHTSQGSLLPLVAIVAITISLAGCGGPSRDEILKTVNESLLETPGDPANPPNFGDHLTVVSEKICNDGVPHPKAPVLSPPTDPDADYYYPAFRVLKVEHPKERLVDPAAVELVWPVEVELHVACEDRCLIDAPQKFELYQWPIEPHSWYVARVGWYPDNQTRTGENQFKWELYVGAFIGILFFVVGTMVNRGLVTWPKWKHWEDELGVALLLLAAFAGLCVGVLAGMGSRFFLMTDVWVQHSVKYYGGGPQRAISEGVLGLVVGVIGALLGGAVWEIVIKTLPKIFKLITKARGHNWASRTSEN